MNLTNCALETTPISTAILKPAGKLAIVLNHSDNTA
jgi:hypothetical protein